MWKYLLSREFRLTVLFIAGLLVSALMLIFYVFLPSYTRQGIYLTVPDLMQKDHAEAIHLLETASLGVELDTLYDFNPRFPPLAVTKQDPPPHSRVKPGRKVYLYINKEAPSQVSFPDIINKSLFEARSELEKWGLKVGRIQYVEGEYSNLVEQARFKNKLLKSGELVNKYSVIELTVSKGPGEKVEYISVKDMLVGEAMNALQLQGFIIGQIQYESKSKEESGLVLRQFPPFSAGDSLARGSSITLLVAGTEPAEALEVAE